MLFAVAFKQALWVDYVNELNAGQGSAGTIQFWDGTMPATCEDPDTGTLVAECAMNSTPWNTAALGVTDANFITPDTDTDAGTVQYFRLTDGAGFVMAQGTCSTSGADINFDNVVFALHDTCNVNSLSITISVTP